MFYRGVKKYEKYKSLIINVWHKRDAILYIATGLCRKCKT